MKYIIGILVVVVLSLGAWHMLEEKHDHYGHKKHHDKMHSEPLVAKEPVRADGSFTIATSFYPLEYALGRIVGDLGDLTNIGAGRDPHDFQPSTQDIVALQSADLVVLQGAEFEPWGEDVVEQLQAESVPVFLATAELELRKAGEAHDEHHDEHEDEDGHEEHGEEDDHAHDDEAHEEDDEMHEDEDEHHDEHEDEDGHDDHHDHAHGEYDPHTWLDPVLFGEAVEHIGEAVATLDPENAEVYEANVAALRAELSELHAAYESSLASCTADEVITSHDAFGYLGDRYTFTIHPIAGISTQDVPSAQTLAELKEEAEEGVNAILLEDSSVTAYGETLANETGLQTLSVNPIAYNIPEGEDYLSLMRSNLNAFQTALACDG